MKNPKHLYLIKIYGNIVELHRREILASYEVGGQERIVTKPGSEIIWSNYPDKIGLTATWEANPTTYPISNKTNTFFSLKEARDKLQKAIDVSLEARSRETAENQKICQNLSQIDLDNLPQETYVSPFTGETT